jgi:hypothetical protein
VGGAEASRTSVRLFARTLGGRDLALGLGALLAETNRRPVRGWIEAGALADAGDTLATVLVFSKLPRWSRWLILASTVGAVTLGALLAPVVDDSSRGGHQA